MLVSSFVSLLLEHKTTTKTRSWRIGAELMPQFIYLPVGFNKSRAFVFPFHFHLFRVSIVLLDSFFH